MKTLDMCFKFILDDDDAYFSGSDKLIVREWIMDNYHIHGELTISVDLVVDCSGDVEVKNKSITSLTNGLFSWGVIDDGYFNCSYCKNLKTLEGAPKEVGWSFVCNHCNNLTSLKGAPEKVGRLFDCGNCPNLKITDSDHEKYKLHKYLVYIPQTIE